mgnify:CR=1 FL=1
MIHLTFDYKSDKDCTTPGQYLKYHRTFQSLTTRELAEKLEKDHGVTVLPMNCEQLKQEDVETILATVLKEFPVTELRFHIPRWMEILPEDHPLKAAAIESAREILKKADQMKDVGGENLAPAGAGIREMTVSRMDRGDPGENRGIVLF